MADKTDEPLVSVTEAGPLAHEDAKGELEIEGQPPKGGDAKTKRDGEIDDTAAAPSA